MLRRAALPKAPLPSVARGTWEAPITDAGRRVLVAVDSRGDEIARAVVTRDDAFEEIVASLDRLLDAADPLRPPVTLVS